MDFQGLLSNPMFQVGAGLLSGSAPGGTLQGGLLKGIQMAQQTQQLKHANQLKDLQAKALQSQIAEQERLAGLREQMSGMFAPQQQPQPGMLNPEMPATTGLPGQEPIAPQQMDMNRFLQLYGQMDPMGAMKMMYTPPPSGKDRYMEVDGNVFDVTTQSYVTPSGKPVGNWTPETMRKEYDYTNYTPESIKQAEQSGDPSKLQPHIGYRKYEDVVGDRKEFAKSRKVFDKVAIAGRQLDKLLGQGGGIADVGAMVNFVKSLDPESVVREGEVKVTQMATGLWNQLQVAIDRAKKEGGALTPTTRQQMKDATQALIEEYKRSYAAEAQPYIRRSESAQIDPSEVLGGDILWPTFETSVYGTEVPPPGFTEVIQ